MHSERWALAAVAIAAVGSLAASAGEMATGSHRSIEELTPTATIRVGNTADWVAISDHAVWVGSGGPDAVSEIDPHTNRLVATIPLPGNPCAGLADPEAMRSVSVTVQSGSRIIMPERFRESRYVTR